MRAAEDTAVASGCVRVGNGFAMYFLQDSSIFGGIGDAIGEMRGDFVKVF